LIDLEKMSKTVGTKMFTLPLKYPKTIVIPKKLTENPDFKYGKSSG